MRVSEAIEIYLQKTRAQGLGYETQEFTLLAFERCITDLPIAEVTSKQILEFLNRRQISYGTWMQEHRVLRKFTEFWTDRGYMSAFSMPQRQRRNDDRRPITFIYTRTQIRNLIQATRGNQS